LLSTVFLPEKNKSSLYENALLNIYATFIRDSFSVKKKKKARFKKIENLVKLEQYYLRLTLACGFS
jgi:hypothetical protein